MGVCYLGDASERVWGWCCLCRLFWFSRFWVRSLQDWDCGVLGSWALGLGDWISGGFHKGSVWGPTGFDAFSQGFRRDLGGS